jgi:PBP1b-binding outer membrane lipoprotein LpoB
MSDRILTLSLIGYRYISVALSLGLIGAILFMSGCVAPAVTVEKNIYIIDSKDVTVKYSTRADLDTAAEIVQDIKPDIKVPLVK